jgi:nicotinate phosphoribosyltransferase
VTPLLTKRLENGKRVEKPQTPHEQLVNAHAVLESQLDSLDATYKRLLNPHVYKVSITKALKDLKLSTIEARYTQG